jgi:acetylornithine deacetylase/succinyl-diaminopimelate desuccinylase-like protein
MDQELLEILFKYYTGNSEDSPSLGVNKCLHDIACYLGSKTDCTCVMQEYAVQDSMGRIVPHCNLIAYRRDIYAKYVLFQGHIDTVPVKGEYSYSLQGDRIVGRGAVDMKGSLAGMIDAFVNVFGKKSDVRRTQSHKIQPMLVITSDEEANSFAGIFKFMKFLSEDNAPEVVFGINGEPNGFTLSTAMKGVLMFDVEKISTNGHSYSAKNPSLIEDSLLLLKKIDNFLSKARKIDNQLMGKTVGALTMINSGVRPNQLPDKFKVHFHLRTVQKGQAYLSIFNELVGEYAEKKDYDTHICNFDPCRVIVPKPFYKKFKGMKETVFGAFSEASLLNSVGNIKTVICGIGDLAQAHSDPKNEVMTFEEMDRYSLFLQKFIAD